MREPSQLFLPVRPSLPSEFPTDESVAWATPRFVTWAGPPPGSTYGGKAIIDHGSEPAFAELAIIKTLRANEWDAVWVSQAFGRPKFRDAFWGKPPAPKVPTSVLNELASLADARGGSYKGTWDVVAWPAASTEPPLNALRFIESKRSGRDSIDVEQINWFKVARARGAANVAFLVVEWTLVEAVT